MPDFDFWCRECKLGFDQGSKVHGVHVEACSTHRVYEHKDMRGTKPRRGVRALSPAEQEAWRR
jgi:hypothetical protein